MLTRLILVILLQYIQISDHYVHLQLICSIIPNFFKYSPTHFLDAKTFNFSMMYVFCLATVAEVKRYKGAKDVGENIVSDDQLWNSEQGEDSSGNTYSFCQCYLAFTNTSLSL